VLLAQGICGTQEYPDKGFLSVIETPTHDQTGDLAMRKLFLLFAILILACISVYPYAVEATPATSLMPEPTSMLLLGSALVGAGAVIRRWFKVRN